MTNDEQKRLDVFALETVLRSTLHVLFVENPERERLIATIFENSVAQFSLRGAVSPENELRDYMLQRGLEWIASASPRPRSTKPEG